MSIVASQVENNWLSESFLNQQITSILSFYARFGIQTGQGFNQSLNTHGTSENPTHYHLVSSCRLVVNFCRGAVLSDDRVEKDKNLAIAKHGLAFIEHHHCWQDGQGYHWELHHGEVIDRDQYCYGYAFLMLTYANAYQAGIKSALPALKSVHQLMQQIFWQEEFGLFADQVHSESGQLSSYRGQNANMHACEALIAAFEATQDDQFLQQALRIANTIVNQQTASTHGLLWEHYNAGWQVDWTYNRHDPQNLYKPWGYQTGHFTEWAKLLLILHDYKPAAWMLDKAKFLVDTAWQRGWDESRGGLYYGFDPQGLVCDDNKYFWVQAETLPALAMLSKHYPDGPYLDYLQRLGAYCESHFIEPTSRVWRRVLNADNQPKDQWVALPGAKCDYHSIGACYDLLRGNSGH
ncbi:MAG: AGE family epimerase/isomerase [Oceanospirillaceae bacterium]|nr:AGE family epimerase/isomerase [Oceanospirillaceae bacterium]